MYCQRKRRESPILWRLYENSLTITLSLIFLFFFIVHARASGLVINEKNVLAHLPTITFLEVFKESEFWFESFQNWQSEFFSIAAIGLLGIFLRQKGSPQSKKLIHPNWKTGET